MNESRLFRNPYLDPSVHKEVSTDQLGLPFALFIPMECVATMTRTTVFKRIGRVLMTFTILLCSTAAYGQFQTSELFEIIEPNGGEFFERGDTVSILFSYPVERSRPSSLDRVRFELSMDNGHSWVPVSDEDHINPTGNDTVVQWIVPDVTCSQCLLRLVRTSGFCGVGDSVFRRQIPSIPAENLFEAVFRDSDSALVINARDRLIVVDLWSEPVGIREILWPGYQELTRLSNIRFGRNDSIILVGSVPTNKIGHSPPIGVSTIFDYYTGDTLRNYSSEQFAAAEGLGKRPLSAGTILSITSDGTRLLRTSHDGTEVRDYWADTIVQPDTLIHGDITWRPATGSGFSPDDSKIVSGSVLGISVLSAETSDLLWTRSAVDAGYVEFSGDGKYILVMPFAENVRYDGGILTERARILDAETGDTVVIFPRYRLNNWRPDWTYGKMASTGTRLVLEKLILDYTLPDITYAPLIELEDPWLQYSLALTSTGSHYAAVSADGVIRVFAIPPAGDTTDAPFSIGGALPLAADLFTGTVKVGESKDTTVVDFLINGSDDAVRVESITIEESDAADFTILDGAGPYDLPAKQNGSISVRFTPSESGTRSARLRIVTNAGVADPEIWGIGKVSVSVEEEDFSSEDLALHLQPNPANDEVLVRLQLASSASCDISIVDLSGRVVFTREEVSLVNGEGLFVLPLEELPSGKYQVSADLPDGRTVSSSLYVAR